MKLKLLTLCLTGVAASLMAADSAPAKVDKQKISYSFGMQYGTFFKSGRSTRMPRVMMPSF